MSHIYLAILNAEVVATISAMDGQDALEHFQKTVPEPTVVCNDHGQDEDKVRQELIYCGQPLPDDWKLNKVSILDF
jgi:hypothetical protein